MSKWCVLKLWYLSLIFVIRLYRYQHPLFAREGPVVVGGDYITTETGTGLVHTAPGHGVEDYQVRPSTVS